MRKTIVVFALLSAALLTLWTVHGITGLAASGDGPGCPLAGDVNGDEGLDISDAVYLLEHLYLGGPPPVACAEGYSCLTGEEAARVRELLEERDFGEKIAGVWMMCDPAVGFPEVILMITPDGGYVDFDANDFAENDDSRYHTGSPGRWVRAGERTVRATLAELVFREDRSLWGVGVQKAEVTFAEDFSEAWGTHCEEDFRPGADINTAASFTNPEASPVYMRRIAPPDCGL
jgi:hypothetical protein